MGTPQRSGCTGPCSDTTSCSPGATDGTLVDSSGMPVAFSGAELASGLDVSVWDSDADASDQIGRATIHASTMQSTYSSSAFGQVVDVSFTLEPPAGH